GRTPSPSGTPPRRPRAASVPPPRWRYLRRSTISSSKPPDASFVPSDPQARFVIANHYTRRPALGNRSAEQLPEEVGDPLQQLPQGELHFHVLRRGRLFPYTTRQVLPVALRSRRVTRRNRGPAYRTPRI